jgi:predicted O-methyltransferase YrrM
MRALGRVCLLSISTAIYLSQVAASPSAAQSRAPSAEPGSHRAGAGAAAEQASRAADREGPGAVIQHKGLESVLGREVRTKVDEDVGRVIDLLVDRNGTIHAAVIEFGGFLGIGTRKIAVEWQAMRFETDGKQTVVTVDVTRDQLRVAPEYKPSEPAVVRRASE